MGKRLEKVVLPLFPIQYHGETQEDEIEFTTNGGYETKKEIIMNESMHRVNDKPFKHTPLGMGECCCALDDEDLEDAILA
jgi:hypothetical protein